MQSGRSLMPRIAGTGVSNIFFSTDNENALQQGIRYGVYRESNGTVVIGNQSRDELLIIMRSTYLEHSFNLPHNLLEQVRALNKMVLEYTVPRVLQEARAYQKYRFDIDTQPVPLERGEYTSRSGLRGQF